MKVQRSIFYLVLLLAGAAILLFRWQMHTLIPHWSWESLPVHSTVEAVGALAAILMAVFLLERRLGEGRRRLLLPALGFIGMGLLDGLHALSLPGQGFVFLHSVASLVGGLFFALAWLPESERYASWKKGLPWAVTAGSILFGIWPLLFPETLPAMVQNGAFTPAAVAINLFAGVLFIAGASHFLLEFYRSGDLSDYLFSSLALLFGFAELTFKYSSLWSDEWWFWHMLRLTAYIFALALVIRGFLRMLADLRVTLAERRRAEEEVRRLNEDLERRVIERTTQLEAANKELEAFSYSVSHDLRAPLRSMDGFSQALLEDYADKLDAQGQGYLQRVRVASQRMAQLIDDMLTLSRVTRSEIQRETVDLSALAEKIAAELQKTQPERQVEFAISKGVIARGDARLLQVVVENLLGNAWKFTAKHPHARIEFGVAEQDGKSAYFVRDDGVGFDMAYADKLFAPFQRLHHTSEFPGSGVGLATVQRIIHRHGGQVWAEGQIEGGATFCFTL